MAGPRICDKCKGTCLPLACSANLPASEDYCHKCHKSYPMGQDRANAILDMEYQQRQAAAQRRHR